MTAKKHEAFGSLLSAAISYIAACEHKTTARVEEELGAVLGVAGKTVQRYKSGVLPPVDHAQDRIRLLAEAIVQRRVGSLGREWLERFLHAARYPAADSLLNELCPMHAVRPTPERVYQNLPAPTYDQFVMREQAFSEVVDGLGQRAAAMLIVGLGGNGKTSLAREVAAHCLQDGDAAPRFDAVVWVSDKDNPGTTNQSTVLDVIARTLDYPGFTQFPHDEKQYEVEQLLRRQRVLLIIDNAETITDGALFTWLLRLPEPSKAIITSRERSRILWSSWLVELRGMREDEARTLLQQRLARLRIAHLVHDPAQLEPLLVATGGNPKAITLVAGLLKYERRPLQQIIADLYAARGDLFDDLFSRAWALLDAAGQRILMVMTFFPDSAGDAALSTTADVTGFDFDRAVERLTDLSLLDLQQADLTSAPRYLLHPLVRAFAGARLAEQPEFKRTARERWVKWYVDLASNVGYCWDDLSRLDALDSEHENVLTVLHWTHQHQQYAETTVLAAGSSYYYHVRGLWEITADIHWKRYDAAARLNDEQEAVEALALYTQLLCKRDRFPEAESYLQRLHERLIHGAVTMSTAIAWKGAEVAYRIGHGDFTAAKDAILREVPIHARDVTEQNVMFYQLTTDLMLGNLLYDQGAFAAAKRIYTETLPAVATLGSQPGIIGTKSRLASIELVQQNLEEAEQLTTECYTQAMTYQDKRALARIQRTFAQLHIARGDWEAARLALVESIDMLERQGRRRELAEARAELARLEAQMAAAAE
jgi:LuxR family glucitol operon transcriptional activator